jgi:hypothetical protein
MCVLFLFIASADLQIRLNGSGNSLNGRVEIFHPNFGWGTVCHDSWDNTDGNVVCRQLGFARANVVRNRAYYGKGSGPILLDEVGCNGKESHIWDCSHGGWNKHDCSHSEDAGVECLCKKGYTFDGSGCVGMYPLPPPPYVLPFRKHMFVYHCTNVITIIYLFHQDFFPVNQTIRFHKMFNSWYLEYTLLPIQACNKYSPKYIWLTYWLFSHHFQYCK